jgi:hypothetical protein
MLNIKSDQMSATQDSYSRSEAKTTPMYTHAALPTPPTEPSQFPTVAEADSGATPQSTLYDHHFPTSEDGWTTIARTHSRHFSSLRPSRLASPANPRAAASKLGDEEDYDVLSPVPQYTQSYPSPMSSWVLSPSPSPLPSPDVTFPRQDYVVVEETSPESRIDDAVPNMKATVEDAEAEEALQDYESI